MMEYHCLATLSTRILVRTYSIRIKGDSCLSGSRFVEAAQCPRGGVEARAGRSDHVINLLVAFVPTVQFYASACCAPFLLELVNVVRAFFNAVVCNYLILLLSTLH